MDPTALFATLTQFATQDPVGASLTASAVYGAGRWAAATLWKAVRPEDNLFDILWQEAVQQATADWPEEILVARLRDIRGAFAAGQVCTVEQFAGLLQRAGADPDIAGKVLEELEERLREAVLHAARTDPRAFQPTVLDGLREIGLLGTEAVTLLKGMAADIAEMREDVRQIKDRIPCRADEFRPPEAGTLYEFNDEDWVLLDGAHMALTTAPDLIRGGHLEDARAHLVACRNDLTVLTQRLRRAKAPAEQQRQVDVLVAWTDIELGSVALEAHQYLVAAEVHQRAADRARDAGDGDALFLATYQTGVALAYAQLWREAEPWVREAARLRPADLGARGALASVLRNVGQDHEAIAVCEEVVRELRELPPPAQTDHAATLTRMLTSLGLGYRRVGAWGKAEAAFVEALAASSQLPQAERASKLDRGIALHDYAELLGDLGRWHDSVAAFRDALQAFQEVSREDPRPLRPQLTATLIGLGVALGGAGDRRGALDTLEAAVLAARELAEENSAAFRARLAAALLNVAEARRAVGLREDALTATDDAEALYRQLADAQPRVFLPDLALVLNNRGILLSTMRRTAGAYAALDEALTIRRELAERDPQRSPTEVAQTLFNMATVLQEMERRDEAREAWDEPIEILQPLAAQYPEAFAERLATAKQNREQLR